MAGDASDIKVTGDLKLGGIVTINCSEPNAQKQEWLTAMHGGHRAVDSSGNGA